MKIAIGGSIINSDRASEEYLAVNNCGYQIIDERPSTTIRAHGRLDYLLLYVVEGCVRALTAEGAHALRAGDMVLYKPGERQVYTHEPHTEVYWLHFTGLAVPEIMRKCALWERATFHVGPLPELPELVRQMISEIQRREWQYETRLNAHFLTLLTCMSRGMRPSRSEAEQGRFACLNGALDTMRVVQSEGLSTRELAAKCNLSESHFIHLFKECTGLSPHAYHTRLRMERAKDLLAATGMSVSEVGFSLGYANPLYFSRLFTKYAGLSPSAFRRQCI